MINQTPYYNLKGRGPAVMAAVQDDTRQGFTLMEILIVILVIAILAAIAVPQYQKAVLKSRYSAMMPIGKAVADGNEVYYMEKGEYAQSPTALDVAGQSAKYPDGTQVSIPQEDEALSYVLVTNDSVPNARYLVYQKHSPSFPDTTMCEAGDERANELCQAVGGVTLSGGGNSLGAAEWTAYLLTGSQGSSSFCPPGATCNSQGEVTECASGKTLKEGKCVTCDIENAATCSTTSYEATSCENGYCMKNGACGTCDFTTGCPYCATGNCYDKTFGGNSQCCDGNCQFASFSGESQCGLWGRSASCAKATFTDTATCTNGAHCYDAIFSGNASCDGSAHTTYCSRGVFTEDASCIGNAACGGAVFSGNSICTSTYGSDGGCAFPNDVSTFKDNAVCAGNGCRYANYEGNACCAGTSCPSGVRKCVYNSTTETYDQDGYWD